MRRPWAFHAARVTSFVLLGAPLMTVAVAFAPQRATAAVVSPPVVVSVPPGTELLDVRTVPPIADASFVFAGTRFATDPATGNAWLLVSAREARAIPPDGVGGLVTTAATTTVAPDVRARFTGWSGSGHAGDVITRVALFELDSLAAFRFVDARGRATAPGALERLYIRRDDGTIVTIDGGKAAWLPTTRSVVSDGSATSVPIRYSPSAALVYGRYVVALRPSSFAPSPQQPITIALRCFDVRVVTSRSIFGDRVRSLALRYPDGRTRRIRLDGDGAASLPCIPGGRYEVSAGGSSLLLTRSINVTGDVRAHVVDVTDVDLAAVVALVVANVAAAVVWFRHRRGRAPSAVVP